MIPHSNSPYSNYSFKEKLKKKPPTRNLTCGTLRRAAIFVNAAGPKNEMDMFYRHVPSIFAILALAGCTMPTTKSSDRTRVGNVPEAVAALAAANQDLTSARLLLEDNCYWYEHSGPVETTLLPLRSAGGNPICLSRAS